MKFASVILLFLQLCGVFSSSPILGEIRMFGGNFAPRGWAFCHGQLLSISQYSALFSLLGTSYGGDGSTTFALPDMRGRVTVGFGEGPGLSAYDIGQKGGVESVTLTENQIPSHTHKVEVLNTGATSTSVLPPVLDGTCDAVTIESLVIKEPDDNKYTDSPIDSRATGGSQSHTNIQPYITVSYIIALEGVYPSRN